MAVTGLCKRYLSRRLIYSLTKFLDLILSKNKIVRLLPGLKMVGPDGLEPSTPRLSSACSNQLSYEPQFLSGVQLGGAGRSRTDDPLLAKQVLYQLSYDPE
jgi:hypothetical protein